MHNIPIYDTAFGYVQGIIQNLLSSNNSENQTLIEKIRASSSKFVYPFVAIMNASSAEYIFDIIGYLEEGFEGFKEELFEIIVKCYLPYSSECHKFQTIQEEIQFWTDSFAKHTIKGIS